jgi:hypothetical protein
MQVLVVDAANVVGSRPDGWWRDRAGAARRLRERLLAAELPYDEVVLVLEGRARGGADEGREGRLLTVHAAGSGDDRIVEVVGERTAERRTVEVVTADRGLRARVQALGAVVVGPGSLLARL